MPKLLNGMWSLEKRLLRWQGSFVWACAHAAPGIFLRSVPNSDIGFSFGSLYIFAQALGLVWMFLVVLLAVMSVRIVSAAVDSPDGTLPGYGEQPLRSVALCYVYYSVLRLLFLFARSMWTVAWELYHDFPTLRRMLLGANRFHESRASPREKRSMPSPRGKGSKDTTNDKDSHITQARRQARRRIVLITPLLVLALGHLTLLLGQSYCDGQDGRVSGICSDALPIFQPTGHLNRTVRFVLFVSLIQWFQAFTGLFANFSWAIAQGKGLVPRVVSMTLLCLLMPISTWRLFTWLVQPAGSGVVRRTLGGLPHHVADTALVTAWSWWSLLAVSVVMRPQLLGLSGFTLRSVSLDARWRNLTTLFKYTLFFWIGVHFLRGCVAHGFASAQTDLITISFVYPMLLCFVWTATFIAVSLSGIFRGPLPWLGAAVALPGIFFLSQLLCSWVGRDQHVLLTTLVWLHLLRAGFRMARYAGLWLKSSTLGSPSGQETIPPIEIKFAVNPDSHKVLKTTYTVERRLGRIAARVLLLICGTFLVILTSCVMLAGLQQRSGFFLEDLLWWQELDERTIEVTNAGASVMTLASSINSATQGLQSDTDAFTRVLERNTTGHYAVCGHTWHSLQLVDYALLSMLAYITPSEKNELPKLLKKLFPHLEVSIRHLPSLQNRRWLVFEVKRCQSGGLWTGWQEGACRSLSVVSVSGTDISRIADYAENLRMWTEPVALQILQTMFPTIRIWPRDSSSMVIRTIHDILSGLGLEDNQWHYSEILDYVRQIPREQEVVVTGHSLGGGIALVVGALTDRLAVALQPPGVFYSLAKHEAAQRDKGRHGALHQRSVSLVFEGDWIGNFDGHGGLVQTMLCDQSKKSIAVGCHLLEGAICHLLRHCGDDAERFDVCRHEYKPGHTVLNIMRTVWHFVQMTFQSNLLQIDIQGFMVACVGASFLVVLRHGAPPMLRAALQP